VAVAVAPAEVGFSAEFVALIFAFLFLWLAISVLDAIRVPTVNLAGAVPLVGGALRSAAETAFAAARGWLYNYLSASLVAYATLLGWLQTLWAASGQLLLDWSSATVLAIFHLRTVVIPAYAASLTTWAQGQIAALHAFALAQGVAASALAHSLFAVAEQDIAAATAAAEVGALRAQQAAEAAAAGLFAVAEADAAALVQAERAFVVGEVLGVEAQIQAAFRQATAIAAGAEAALRGDLGAVQQELSGSIRSEVDALLKQIEADKAALSAALAGGLAAVIADVAAIRALRCIQRCAELGALGEVLNILDVSLLLALYVAARNNPRATADFLAGQVRPFMAELASEGRAVFGGL